MAQGWIKLYRKLLDNTTVCRDSDHFAVWGYLVLKATHKNIFSYFRGERVELFPGQLITSRRSISDFFCISESKVQRILKDFETAQQIEQRTSSKNRLITVLNWESYQDDEQRAERQPNGKRTTNGRPANGRRTASEHKQECKEYKNEKNIGGCAASPPPVDDERARLIAELRR